MLAKLSPHPDQIRWYVESALGAFETLDEPDAVAMAVEDLRAVLRYLDALDRAEDTVAVTLIRPVEPVLRDEVFLG